MSKITQITEPFELIRNGQQYEGVALLYEYHYNKMYGIAFSITKKEDVSEDVVHNVIQKLLLLEKNKFPLASELTWLYTVVKNESLMFLRNKKRSISLDALTTEPAFEDKNIHDFVDMDTYYSMIKGLDEKQRQIVTLKVMGGYTHKEIADMLGKPVGTIQWIYNTSIKRLKIILSSILAATVLSAVGFVTRLVNYVVKINKKPSVGEIMGKPMRIPFDYFIVVFAVLFACFLILFLIVLKKFSKNPTKSHKKSI